MGRRVELLLRVLAESGLWGLPWRYVREVVEVAEKLRVPARMDVVKNFIAAYMVVRGLMSKSIADRVVASSSRGRRLWEKKLCSTQYSRR